MTEENKDIEEDIEEDTETKKTCNDEDLMDMAFEAIDDSITGNEDMSLPCPVTLGTMFRALNDTIMNVDGNESLSREQLFAEGVLISSGHSTFAVTGSEGFFGAIGEGIKAIWNWIVGAIKSIWNWITGKGNSSGKSVEEKVENVESNVKATKITEPPPPAFVAAIEQPDPPPLPGVEVEETIVRITEFGKERVAKGDVKDIVEEATKKEKISPAEAKALHNTIRKITSLIPEKGNEALIASMTQAYAIRDYVACKNFVKNYFTKVKTDKEYQELLWEKVSPLLVKWESVDGLKFLALESMLKRCSLRAESILFTLYLDQPLNNRDPKLGVVSSIYLVNRETIDLAISSLEMIDSLVDMASKELIALEKQVTDPDIANIVGSTVRKLNSGNVPPSLKSYIEVNTFSSSKDEESRSRVKDAGFSSPEVTKDDMAKLNELAPKIIGKSLNYDARDKVYNTKEIEDLIKSNLRKAKSEIDLGWVINNVGRTKKIKQDVSYVAKEIISKFKSKESEFSRLVASTDEKDTPAESRTIGAIMQGVATSITGLNSLLRIETDVDYIAEELIEIFLDKDFLEMRKL